MTAKSDRQREIGIDTRNSLAQLDELLLLVDEMDGVLSLSPEIIKHLHAIGMRELHPSSGSYRTVPIRIRGVAHRPPPHDTVAGLVEQMCEDANNAENDPIQTCAFVLWRLNRIHPFPDRKRSNFTSGFLSGVMRSTGSKTSRDLDDPPSS